MLSDTRVQLAAAGQMQAEATQNIVAATMRSSELEERTTIAIAKFEVVEADVEKRMNAFGEQAASLSDRLAKGSQTGLEVSADLREQIAEISAVVEDLFSSVDIASGDREAISDRLVGVGNSLKLSKSGIETATKQAELSKYPISVISELPDADSLIVQLEKEGYSVSRFEDVQSADYVSAIVVGKNIPIANAIPILKLVRQHYPNMNFLIVRSNSNKISIGKSISKSARNPIGGPAQESDFERLFAAQSQEEWDEQLRSLFCKSFGYGPC